MELEHELENYINENFKDSPEKAAEFLIKTWNSSSIESSEKYNVILKYFMDKIFNQLLTKNGSDLILKEMLQLKFPPNSVSYDVIKLVIKNIKQMLQIENSLKFIEIFTSMISNESYKKYFKGDLSAYCKLIGTSLKCFDKPNCENKFEALDEIIRELHYFAKSRMFAKHFRQDILVPLNRAANNENYERINDVSNLIKSIYFSRLSSSLDEENSKDTSLDFLVSDDEITFEQMEVLIESFIISFKSESTEIIKFLNHFNEEVLSKYEKNNILYLSHVRMLYALLKKHEIEIATFKKLESSFEEFSTNILDRVISSIDEMNLSEYFHTLSIIISYDPFLFVENNMVYKIIVECMMKEKSETDMNEYETLLITILRIFGKDIYQFMKKLLSAIDSKLDNFVIPKKRKRKITNESDSSSKKKLKSIDGSAVIIDSFNVTNIWPNSLKTHIDEIFSDINVNQTTKLWKLLNDSLREVISTLKDTINENVLFKMDFISSLICQLVTSSRIHEHLVYKSPEISQAIDDFNDVQHNFYNTIIKIEYNNRIMNAFLKMSCDYENFIMMYFYHYEEDVKSELDQIFITDKTRIKSGEWKIIQQRIKNFGKVEEKTYSNLLIIQHFLRSKLFKITAHEDTNEFLQNLMKDKEQINLLLDRKDIRLHIFTLLKDEASVENLFQDLWSKIQNDNEKISIVLNLSRSNSEMLELFTKNILANYGQHNLEIIEIIKQLPIASLSQSNKKIFIQKLLLESEEPANEIDKTNLIIIFNKIFKNDGYKNFFKDFSMKNLFEKLEDVAEYRPIYEMVIKTSLKKMTIEVLKNLEWIIKEGKSMNLTEILGKLLCDVNPTPTNECNTEKVNNFKLEVIDFISSKLNETNVVKNQQLFCTFSRLCSQNMQLLKDETKEQHMKLLSKLLKSTTKTSAMDSTAELFMLTLKDAKKLNLNDEIKADIVKTLTKHLYSIIEDAMSKENDEKVESGNEERERSLIATLSSFKSNCREECSHHLYKLLKSREIINENQLIYSFKIYELLFESCEKTERKENTTLIKNYMKHCENYVKAREPITELDLLYAIYSCHIAMMKCFKEKLDFITIDELFAFHIDQKNRPVTVNVESFCKFYEIVGQFLFVLGNFQQNYFKSRIPLYFKAYNKFLDTIYYYEADDKKELDAKESSMLLRLTLQLENIMKMLMKLHSNSFSIISPYIVSSIVNVFVKTPKMLNVGDKFKVNIKNICYQLLSTFDDKTRKHIYAVVDESTRDVYDSLFKEIKRK